MLKVRVCSVVFPQKAALFRKRGALKVRLFERQSGVCVVLDTDVIKKFISKVSLNVVLREEHTGVLDVLRSGRPY